MERGRPTLMRSLFKKIARWTGLSEKRCPVCSALMASGTGPVCPECAESMRPRTGGYCTKCGEMFGSNTDTPTICAACRLDPPQWDTLHFHGRYDGVLRDMILSYKFNGGLGKTRLLSNMAVAALQRSNFRTPDLIVPVPLHTKRLQWRGFNQSTELARALGRTLHRPVPKTALTRVRHTPPQTRLGLKERQSNIKNAFAADPDKVNGKVILMVDDVYTTGSTLGECTRTLRRAGAAGVDVLVLARAQQEPA
ncbi:ComF family protein [uncultured Pseudodesulfovibrio sp.]|uniref:ComF family protein n=1 Tax=uncultured Pseudodesulfovibrio sp. TaxID=2035858 RepID=UPI0029C6D56A|nr:ComF family protein [uncultured Pseudodesulfovibrio sp.]